MSKLKFEWADFCDLKGLPIDQIEKLPLGALSDAAKLQAVANKAQELFDAWLEKQPTVYGNGVLVGEFSSQVGDYFNWSQQKDPELLDLYQAKLVCIEEIKK